MGPFELPPRAVLVPVGFIDDGPPSTPTLTVSPTTDLVDRQTVTVRAEGLRPNRSFVIGQCGSGHSVSCGAAAGSSEVTSDAGGILGATVVVASVVYSTLQGRTDCTASPCAITIRDETFQALASVPIAFAPGVDAPTPELTIDPPGPYTPGQDVTVSGTGFPVGERVRLGQCPVGLDTAVAERCSYPIPFMAIVVEPDGTFTATAELGLGTALGPCGPDLACQLGWVLINGPTVATAPLPTTG